jgi:hypothetical protein
MGVAGVARAPLWRPDSDSVTVPVASAVAVAVDLLVPLSRIHEFPADCCTSVLYNGFNNHHMLAFHTGCCELNAKAVRYF